MNCRCIISVDVEDYFQVEAFAGVIDRSQWNDYACRVERNTERGLLGYTGTWKGKPISVQGTGMGCPGATIVFEELVQLGCKKLIRVNTPGVTSADLTQFAFDRRRRPMYPFELDTTWRPEG